MCGCKLMYEVRGQSVKVAFLLSLCGFQGANLGFSLPIYLLIHLASPGEHQKQIMNLDIQLLLHLLTEKW